MEHRPTLTNIKMFPIKLDFDGYCPEKSDERMLRNLKFRTTEEICPGRRET